MEHILSYLLHFQQPLTVLMGHLKKRYLNIRSTFQDSIRNNVSYVFLDAILKEVHNVQDGSMTILANDDSERENLSGVSAEELIQTVEFTELKENNEVISYKYTFGCYK